MSPTVSPDYGGSPVDLDNAAELFAKGLDAEEAVAAEAQNDELWANLMGKLKIDPSSKDVARSCAYLIVGDEAPASVYVEGGGAALDLFLGGLRLLDPSTGSSTPSARVRTST